MTLSYRELNDNSEEVPGNVLALMLSMRHSCNPDFESQYEHVVKWYAEIDTTMARVLREIGLDHSGNPIVLGPFGRNDGLWTGVSASVGVDIHHTPTISKDLFDSTWNKLEDVYRNTIPPKKIEPRIPVEHIEQITDKWSGSALGGLGSMSDQIISFLPDGTGFFEDLNYVLMYYHEFQWSITKPGWIRIQGRACYEQNEKKEIVESKSDFNYENISAECQVHHSGNGRSINVLFLPLKNEQRPWVSNAYGSLGWSGSEIERPEFW